MVGADADDEEENGNEKNDFDDDEALVVAEVAGRPRGWAAHFVRHLSDSVDNLPMPP